MEAAKATTLTVWLGHYTKYNVHTDSSDHREEGTADLDEGGGGYKQESQEEEVTMKIFICFQQQSVIFNKNNF